MAREGEKTIKVSADTDDVRKAFKDVEAAYASVADAAKQYAAAVDVASNAITDDEKKIAEENERATKIILANSRKRAGALKTNAIALQEQQKSLKLSIAGENKAEKQSDALSRSASGASSSLMGKAAAFGAMGAAAMGAVGVLLQLISKYAELDSANGRLANSLKNAGASTEAMAEAEALATEMVQRGQASRLESINSIRLLTDASGNATQAIDDYRLAVDIASQTGKTAAEASELLNKVRKGEVEELKSMRGLNKELAEDLGKIEDATVKTEIAMQFLKDGYSGAAEANAGLIDKQAAMKFSQEDLLTSVGSLLSAIGETGGGLIGSYLQMAGVIDKSLSPIETVSSAFRNFAASMREASQPLQDIAAAGGIFGTWFKGKSISEAISEADSARAVAAAKKKEGDKKAVDSTGKVIEAVDKQAEAEKRLKDTLDAQARTREEQSKRAKDQAEAEKKRAKQAADYAQRQKNLQDEARKAAQEAAAYEQQLAREKEARDAEEIAIAQERASQHIEEMKTRIEQEFELRQALEMQKAVANDADIQALGEIQALERDLFDIRSSAASDGEKQQLTRIRMVRQETTNLEKLKQKTAETAEQEAKRTASAIAATEGLGVAALEAAGMSNAGTALEAGKKAAFYTGESIASFAALNPVSGTLFAVAAAHQAVVAGGALIGGGGGGGARSGGGGASSVTGSSPASVAPSSRSSQSMAPASGGAREMGITINNNMLSYIAPEDQRRMAVAESREARAIVGGRK
jgi:hypothetical protein